MRLPRLDVPLELELPLSEPDGAGGIRLSWQRAGRIWAEMRSGVGGERVSGVGVQSTVTWRIVVRAATPGDPRRPRAGQRLSMAGARRFLIQSVAELDPAGRYLLCLAREEAAE